MKEKPMSPDQMLSEIEDFVKTNAALVEKGKFVELRGLDSQVEKLCHAVANLTREQAVAYADRLQALHTALTQLGEELTAERDSLRGKIENLSNFRKASVAYATSSAMRKGKPADDDSGETDQ